MTTAVNLQSGQSTANHRIFSILQGAMKVSKEVRESLGCAAEAFHGKSYKTAATYYNKALSLWTAKEEKRENQLLILTKYMLCICWLESTDAKNLLDSLRTLKELENNYGCEYPMLYYAIGKAYFKLYRFNEADKMLKRGFSILNDGIHVKEYNIPGTNIVIPESSKERLVAALVTLNEQSSSWHRPDAVCCMSDCSNHSHNEGINKHIFFGSPTFNGMVQVSCNNPNVCIMNFHSACWKAKKEQLCSLGKMSDKEVLNWECFTPNCENQGVRCTIKKIEIYDENAKTKAVIPRPEDMTWHAKPNPSPKGAIRKQQQQLVPKAKVPSTECRPALYERSVRSHSVPNNVSAHNNTSTHRAKNEENDEDDDMDDEQVLKMNIEKLQDLRANNFGIRDDAIWRPDLQMYGNDYMLATAKLTPDPYFGNSGDQEADLKAFFFSYFFEFISNNGPVKLDVLAKKWIEAKDAHVNSDAILKSYLDISEFLLQSLKFAVIGEYMCVPEKLPEAYELAKNDTCEVLRFFMEHDIDQLSNSSSIDEDAVYDAIVNLDNSLPYSSVSFDDTEIAQEFGDVSNPPSHIPKKKDKKSINNLKATKAVSSSPPPTPKTGKTKSSSKSSSNTQGNKKTTALEIVADSKTVEGKKSTDLSQIRAEKNVPVTTPIRETEKRPYSQDCPAAAVTDKKSEPLVKKATENSIESLFTAISSIHKPREEKDFLPLKTSFSFEKLTGSSEPKFNFTKESKSTNDLRASVASLAENPKVMMNNSGEPDDGILGERRFLSPRRRNESTLEYEKISDSSEVFDEMLCDFSTELAECKSKMQALESELKDEKEKHATTRIRMLEKSLQCQYAYNNSKIMMRAEECRWNIEFCIEIQTMLKKALGIDTALNYETKWTKVMDELEEISNSHEIRFKELNKKIISAKEPQKLPELKIELEPLPPMPPNHLIDLIQAAFDAYRIQLMNELQRMFPPPPTTAFRPPQPQTIGTSQYWQPNADFYAGPQLVHGNPGLAHQQNYLRNLSSISQRNSANSVAQNPQSFPNVQLPPPLKIPRYPYTGMTYPPVNPAGLQMQPIPSAPVQQPVFTPPQQATSEQQQNISPFQLNSSPVHQIARPNSAPTFAAPARPKRSTLIQSPSPLAFPQNFSNLIEENGKPAEKSVNSSMTFQQLSTKFLKGHSSFVIPEIPPVSSAIERSSTPLLRNSTFTANEENLEQPTTANAQGVNVVPEIPKIVKEEQYAATAAQKVSSDQENMKNGGASEICVKQLEQLDLNKKDQPCVARGNNGAKKKQPNSKILKAPPLVRDEPQVNTRKDIHVRATEITPEHAPSAKSKTVLKVNEKRKDIDASLESSNVAPKEIKTRKKTEHSIDKLMKKLRKQYAGVLELDLLKAVESVRKLHNNSLSRIPISEIIREADRFILNRQQKQLCSYIKRMPNMYRGASNATNRSSSIPKVEEECKRQTSGSSSANALKKQPQNSSSVKKTWEPVAIPNDGWKKEAPETDCTICLENMRHTVSYTLQCQHTFHKKCIKNWYQHNQSCPTCRVHSTIDDEYPPLPLG